MQVPQESLQLTLTNSTFSHNFGTEARLEHTKELKSAQPIVEMVENILMVMLVWGFKKKTYTLHSWEDIWSEKIHYYHIS